MNESKILLLLLTGLFFLAGCGIKPQKDFTATEIQQLRDAKQQRLHQLTHWKINGSIAAYSEKEDWSARFNWQQHQQDYTLRLNAPLGQGMVKLSGNDQGVILKTADRTLQADSPEALLRDDAGISMPVSYLYYWMRGLSVPNITTTKLWNKQHHLSVLEQDGWHVEFIKYEQWGSLLLPKKLIIKNQQYYAKVVISNWELFNSH